MTRANDPRGTAIALSFGYFDRPSAKTAHGLIRGGERFDIIGLVDSKLRLPSAKWPVLPPVFASVADALRALPVRPQFAIVGVAFTGGRLPEAFRADIAMVLRAGVSVVSGLHELLGEDAEFRAAAEAGGAAIYDVRKPRPWSELRFWNGDIFDVRAPVVAVLGTDCALGKRTTARLAVEGCRARGLNAHMIYTGQTGWMQGGRYGFVLDATLADFVAGELEGAVLRCDRAERPDLILLEGQSSLRNPAGPCGSWFMLSANARAVVLQIAPNRKYYAGRVAIPRVEDEIALIARYGSRVICVAVNEDGMTADAADALRDRLERELGIPVVFPLRSMEGLTECLAQYVESCRVS